MVVLTYSAIDYVLFCLIFGISIIIGIYYGCCGNKQSTTIDYLYGGKTMNVIPVATSMIIGAVSGITLLGVPAEIYTYGTQYSVTVVGTILVGFITNYVYLPVFYKLQLSSAYEYLRLRFDKNVSKLATFLFIISTLLYLPIVVYAPSLAFNQLTGFNLHYIAVVMQVICVFYTTIGGLKSVIWTDTIQFIATFCILIGILVLGTYSVGGIGKIWEKAQLGDRIEFFNVNPDPTIRVSFWSAILGSIFHSLSMVTVNPSGVQRFLATQSFKSAQRTTICYVIGNIVVSCICCYSGLLIYAKYYDCDPLVTHQIKIADQIFPYFVMDVVSNIPGITGLFLAGIFSAALTTLSTFLNTLSGLIYTECIVPFLSKQPTDFVATSVMKVTTIIVGIITLCLVLVVEKLGTIIEIFSSLNGITSGPLLGLFTLGMLFPFANTKGALCGAISSILLMSWIIIKTKLSSLKYCTKPLYSYGCNSTKVLNDISKITSSPPITCEQDEVFWLYKITFNYYVVLGTMIVLILGVLVSCITGRSPKGVHPDLISPFLHRCVYKSTSSTKSLEKDLPNENEVVTKM